MDKLTKIENICREQRIMENYYCVESFGDNEPYFTTSQETDIQMMLSDGLDINEIISIIKQW